MLLTVYKIPRDEYKLWRLPKKHGVSSVNDLYHVLFYHWVYDDTVFRDEQQRNCVPTDILMASYFGCRPVYMFDTRSRFADKDNACNSSAYTTAASRSENGDEYTEAQGIKNCIDWDDDRATLVNLDRDLTSLIDRSTYWDNDSDSCTNDGVDEGLDETGSLLWRHITFIVAPNCIFGEPNILFAKVTITHTKGEDNYPCK